MTWPWHTCSSLLLVVLTVGTLGAAGVGGSVKLVDSRDPLVRTRNDFSGVAIWLEPLNGTALPQASAPQRAVMKQKGKKFIPHILVVETGTTVDFPNFDPIFHNAFSNFSGQPFDVGLYPPGTSQKVQFRRAGVVRVFCNIHPSMSAIIVVTPGPHSALTRTDGAFAISGVPPGEYRLKVFHERAQPDTLQALEKTVTVPAAGLRLPLLTISEAGFLPVPHKNKHGRDYPPQTEEVPGYSRK